MIKKSVCSCGEKITPNNLRKHLGGTTHIEFVQGLPDSDDLKRELQLELDSLNGERK